VTGARVTVRRGGVSLRVDLRPLAVAGALAVAAAAVVVVSVAVGEFAIPPGDVVASLFGAGDRATDFVGSTCACRAR